MKNSIVKLHNREDNSVILVNFEDVPVVDTVETDDRIFSMIYLSVFRDDIDNYFEVNETPDKIFAAYPDVKKYFIKLHNAETNLTLYLNCEEIHLIDTAKVNDKSCSIIYTNENSIEKIVVNETPEKIYSMIEEYYKTVPNNGQ